MKRKIPLLLLLSVFLAPGVMASDRSALLPPDQASVVLKQCSRPTPAGVDGTWIVPQAIIDKLESDLPKLSKLTAQQCCVPGGKVDNPDAYFRQYVGIMIHGKKYVYINASRASFSDGNARNNDAWKQTPVMVCDGGKGFWGALYDPENGEFSDLAFNGLA